MKRKGIALVVSMMVILMLSLLAAGMMFTIKNESAISTYQASSVQSAAVAEAAVDEIKFRMRLPDSDPFFIGDTANPLNPDWMTVILFSDSADLPTAAADTVFVSSLQNEISGFNPESPELAYTTENFDSDNSLIIRHKTNGDGTKIYFFDSKTQKQFQGDPSLVEQYPPVEIVEITARSGHARKKIIAEVSKQEVNIQVTSALSSAAITWQMTGNTDVYVCGHNHKIETPYTCAPYDPSTAPPHVPGGSGSVVSCWSDTAGLQQKPVYHVEAPYDSLKHPAYNHRFYNYITDTWNINRIEYDQFCSQVGCVAGIATQTSSIGNYGATKQHIFGNPDILIKHTIVIPELYEVLGFESQSEMEEAINWEEITAGSLPIDSVNIRYYKLDGQTTPVSIPSSNSKTRGIIWIDGNMRLNAGSRNFMHKGLLYVSGNLLETSTPGGNYDFWVLGAMMVKGQIDDIHTSGNKRMFFMYCNESLSETVEQDLRYFKLLGWKELN